jgi:NADH dehydrogenase
MGKLTIVIAGTGYGGLAAARALRHHLRTWRVIVIDQHDYHLLQFQLHEAAVNKIDTQALALPLRGLLPRGVEFIQARITGFDFRSHTVKTDRGDIGYDRLVIALGGRPATHNIGGLERALTLKSLQDARRIRGHLTMTLASLALPDGVRRPYPIVIGGAGITGVELAAELSEGLAELTREYGLRRGDVQVLLLEAAPNILPGFDSETVAEALSALRRFGVKVHTRTSIERVEADCIVVRTGESAQVIETGTLIWTGGVRAPWLVSNSGLELAERGAARVDEHLRSVNEPDVSILGDSASVRDPRDGQAVMPTGQLAMKQGQYVAHDIVAEIEGRPRPPYTPHLDGLLISLGGRWGVGYLGPVWVRRWVARVAKTAAETRYLYHIGGLKLLALRWLWLRNEWVSVHRQMLKLAGRVAHNLQISKRMWSHRAEGKHV